MNALGLATKLDACQLWGDGWSSSNCTAQEPALTHALAIMIGAVSAARLASAVLMDARYKATELLNFGSMQSTGATHDPFNFGLKATMKALGGYGSALEATFQQHVGWFCQRANLSHVSAMRTKRACSCVQVAEAPFGDYHKAVPGSETG